ncbi:MAG: hypothetical protein V1802_01105 [Candidatus Aenigmatarchaeota archaeon]
MKIKKAQKIERREKIAIAGFVVSVILFAVLMKISGFSTGTIVNMQNSLFKSALVQGSPIQAFNAAVTSVFTVLLAIVMLVLGFSFLSSYGYYKSNYKIGLISSVSVVFILFVMNASVASIFLSIAIIISAAYIIPLSNTYGKELKRWIHFRVGSNSVSKILMITNILVALGIFFSVASGLESYQSSFKEEITEMTMGMISVPIESGDVATKEMIKDKISDFVENFPMMKTYMQWLPAIVAFEVWVALEFLRAFIFSNIAGLFSYVLIRLQKNKNQ